MVDIPPNTNNPRIIRSFGRITQTPVDVFAPSSPPPRRSAAQARRQEHALGRSPNLQSHVYELHATRKRTYRVGAKVDFFVSKVLDVTFRARTRRDMTMSLF